MHLHIGRSNCIGDAFLSLKSADLVISHRQVAEFDFNEVTRLSISAFDPEKKHRPKQDFWLTSVSNLKSDVIVQYFASGRALMLMNSKFSTYVENKQREINFLRSNFQNTQIFYVPNVVPLSDRFLSGFFKEFVQNFKKGSIRFDVSESSKWDFVPVNGLVKLADFQGNSLGQLSFRCFSGMPITASELTYLANSVNPTSDIVFGAQTEEYIFEDNLEKFVKSKVEIEQAIVKLLVGSIHDA